jgi:hypothetical protein
MLSSLSTPLSILSPSLAGGELTTGAGRGSYRSTESIFNLLI